MKEFDRSAAAKKGWEKSREKYEAVYSKMRADTIARYTGIMCIACGTEIPAEKAKLGNKFCNRSCSAGYNNTIPGKFNGRRDRKPLTICAGCDKEFRPSRDGQLHCSKSCKTENSEKKYIRRWLSGTEDGGKNGQVSVYVRRWLLDKHNHKCSKCRWCEKNPVTGKSPLNVEHIDGNSDNNKPDNLTILCPNCHSLTPTYGSLNIGNGRKSRYAN